tara:strand:+ start:573 stop:1055 length:483 start_codon:yes stop_codon:yes gene_type:complete
MAIIKPNNNTLSAITALPTGLGGKVLQVVQDTSVAQQSTTSTSYVAVSGLTVNITPSAASSKVLVLVSGTLYKPSGAYGLVTVYRDSTDISDSSGTYRGFATQYSSSSNAMSPTSISFLDTPNTTSQITYQLYFRASGGTSYWGEPSGTQSNIQAIEIGA